MQEFLNCAYRFLSHLRIVKNASEHTIRNYCLDLESFRSYFDTQNGNPDSLKLRYEEIGNLPGDVKIIFEGVEKRHIRGYLSHLSLQSATKRTVLRRLSTLRSFFKYLAKEKLIVSNPMDEIEGPKLERTLPASLTYDQVMRLFEQPDTLSYLGFRDRCMMELFYSSGLRVSELAGLNRMDIDRKNYTLRILGKGKKMRVIPITKNAADWIGRYLEHPERERDGEKHQPQADDKAVFLNKWGKRISVRSIDRLFEDYLKKSGLFGKITPHTIRHTIATHWLEKGMDLKTIQTLLGHSSLATTTIYTQVSTRLKRETYDKAHPLALKEDSLT